jgi:hypothetical protein
MAGSPPTPPASPLGPLPEVESSPLRHHDRVAIGQDLIEVFC